MPQKASQHCNVVSVLDKFTREKLLMTIRAWFLSPENPVHSIPVRLGRSQHAVVFQLFACTPLHACKNELRDVGEVPSAIRKRSIAKGFLQLAPVLLEKLCDYYAQAVA